MSTPSKRELLARLLEQKAAQAREAPVSFAQRRLWLLDRIEPGTPRYNVARAVRLRGPLDPDALARSLNALVARHEVLRTSFAVTGDEPVQRILPALTVPIARPVLQATGIEARLAEATALARADARQPFDLGAAPLLRASLLELDHDDFVFVLTMHHIVTDGWSMEVLARELGALYRAFVRDQPAPLPPLPIQYADYARWQRSRLDGEALAAGLEYWSAQLAGAPQILDLPATWPRRGVRSHDGALHAFDVPAALVRRVQRLARDAGASTYMVLLAAFQALLYRYTGREDILVGSTVAGRRDPALEPLVGFFVNTLVLRGRLHGGVSLRALLERTRKTVLEAQEHQDVPFELVVERLCTERDLAYTPMFQVMLDYQKVAPAPEAWPGLEVGPWETVDKQSAIFDLTVLLEERPEGAIRGLIQYSTELFSARMVARLSEHLVTLLAAAVDEPDRPLGELPLLGADEARQILETWNRTERDVPLHASIPQRFTEQAARAPGRVALLFRDQSLTYAALNRQANRLAWLLIEQGVIPGTPVALSIERSFEMVIGLLGILKAGGCYVPLDPDYPDERLRFMLEDCGATLVVTVSSLLQRFAGFGGRVIALDRERALDGRPDHEPGVRLSGDDPAYIIYTSGSTGKPKGVLVPHRGPIRLVIDAEYAALAPDEVLLQLSPLSFDTSVFDLWAALLNGHALALMEPGKPSIDALAHAIRRYGVTTMFMSTGLFQFVVEEQPEALRPLRHLLVGGDTMPPAAAYRMRSACPEVRLTNAYGPTEATVFASSHLVTECALDRSIPIGRPIANTKLYILDQNRQPVPVGVPGELCIGGPGVALGYFQRPELTRERFIPNPFDDRPGERLYRSGDLVRYLDDGTIEFFGRMDNQVKVRGFRVELGEVEVALQSHPSVREAAAVAHGDSAGDRLLVGYYVAGDADLTSEALHEYLRARMPEYMVPTILIRLDRMPLNPSGKVDRKALPAPASGHGEDAPVWPRTPIEERLAEIWSEVLGVTPMAVNRDFFGLGGHSLLATQMASRIRKRLGVEVPLRTIFQHATIAELARALPQPGHAAENDRPQTGAPAGEPGEGGIGPSIERLPRAADDSGRCWFPVSSAQRRMWFLDRLEAGDSRFYNVPWALRLDGPLDVARLQQAFAALVARHESLRTVFVARQGEPYQVVSSEARFELPVLDLHNLPAEASDVALAEHLAAEAEHRFDLAQGPLFRARLLRLSDAQHVLLGNMHHIIVDGWSLDIVLRELAALYGGLVAGQPAPLPVPVIDYADYASWQNTWLRSDALAPRLAYWRAQLRDAPVLSALPTDRLRPAVQTFRGAQHRFRLPDELALQLGALSRAHGVTPFMALLAAFEILLHRYTGQEDLIVGTPVANRDRVEIEHTVGVFINTLALRAELGGDPTYVELLARVKRTTLDAQANQEVPFEMLLDELRVPRSLSHAPLFQVLFVMQNALLEMPAFAQLRAEQMPVSSGTSLLDLSLTMVSHGRELRGFVEYNTDLFDRDTVVRMVEHFQVLLEGIAANPDLPISAYPLLPEREHALIRQWAETRADYGDLRPVHRMIAAAAARSPGATAIVAGAAAVTYAELTHRAGALARHLRALGAGRNVLVGICLPRSADLVVAMLAVLEAGAAFLPINPEEPRGRKRHIAADARLELLITSGDAAEGLGGLVRHVVDLREGLVADPAALPAIEDRAVEDGAMGEDTAYVIYTSGSTGQPKGARIGHRALANHCRGVVDLFAIQPGDRALQFAAVGFDVALEEIMPTLAAGATLVLRPDGPVSLSGFARMVEEQRISILNLPAPFWHEWVDELARRQPPAMPSLRLMVTGSDRVLPEKLAMWQRWYGDSIRWLSGYGPTEATISASFYEPSGALPETSAVPIGKPLPNVRLHVLDAHGRSVPIGVPGEICIGGAGVAQGYLHRDELNAEKFVSDPFSDDATSRMYRTGDLGRFLPDGSIEFLGRADEQVKVRGFRIELGEIESWLLRHEQVADAAVLVRESANGSVQLVAYLAASPGHTLDTRAVAAYLRDSLPVHMVPEVIAVLPALPRTSNGKLDRRALPAPEHENTAAAVVTPPGSGLEREVAAIWSEVLQVPSPDVLTNFFDLGGSSLLLARVHARLEERLQRQIAFHDLFKYPSIRALAAFLGQDGADPASAPAIRRPSRSGRARRSGSVAIIGMAGRFPGASSISALWDLLRDGREGLTRLSDEALAEAGIEQETREHPDYVKVTGLVADAERFDAVFFGYTPREAEVIDPQQRILLQCSWEALEDAGYVPDAQEQPVGVFCGTALSTYLINNLLHSADPGHRSNAVLMQNDINSAATRISYKLNLRGPSVSVQTACSTSLVAVHMACRSLLDGECEMALAGGASLRFPAYSGYMYTREGIGSPDGRCRAFDANAAGTVPSNGAAMVLLKPLEDALRAGDSIYAVIRGSAVNNDGAAKVGYTAPSVEGHARVIRDAWMAAGIEPASLGYVEAHGTGTLLGDPIEVAAFNEAFAGGGIAAGSCALGSIKTNIGHLDVAAGVAGLIKAALMLRYAQLVPSLHFDTPNPKIDFARGPLYVNTEARPWPEGTAPRRAAVSSLGMGGTNAHVVLEEPPAPASAHEPRRLHMLPVSAATSEALDTACARLAETLRAQPELSLADVCYTLQVGRKRFAQRRALICRDREDALRLLEHGDARRVLSAANQRDTAAGVVFLFPGQGAQYPGIGAELYRQEPAFREAADACLAHLPQGDRAALKALLFPDREDEISAAEATLRQTAAAQPALFVIEYAMARLVMSWGVTPSVVLGHSIGEYVAATIAGVFDLPDAMRLVLVRGRLMQSLPAGSMLAVSLPEHELLPLLDASVSLAAVNAPGMCVASGSGEAVAALAEQLQARGVEHRALHTSHAFHSVMMDPIRDAFAAAAGRARPRPPSIPLVSNVTGTFMTAAQATNPAYWVEQLRTCVRFSDGLACALDQGMPILLELGPGAVLSSLAGRQPGVRRDRIVSTMRRPREQGGDAEPLMRAMARLWLAGARIDWQTLHGPGRRRVSLPAHPFARQRFYVSPSGPGSLTSASPASPGNAPESAGQVAPAYERPGLGQEYVPPRTPQESAWADIWRHVFGYGQIGIHDNFYDLGGDSMAGLRIIALAAEQGITVSLSDLFEHQTIEELAQALSAAPHEGQQRGESR